MEIVITHLLELAESRANIARESANNVALIAAAKISDLEQQESPESIMLSSMTEEGSKERTDREVVVPWLKFLWEIYRAILELLHRQAKLEKLYHRTCEKAYFFCLEYKRAQEFRRLCEIMRTQLANLQKMAAIPMKPNKLSWEWTSESIELHLQTRFAQLEVATSLELWNEAFRTVEDIYSIIQIGKKTPKSKLMVSYYEKLTRIFLVSDNFLFHAYAWYKYYTLFIEVKKEIKAEDKTMLANSVLLSALCIPSIKETDSLSPIDNVEIASEKNQRMALLLDFQANPTRQSLLLDIISKGLLEEVSPEISDLYYSLETKFQPLALIKKIAPAIALIKSSPQLSIYSAPLQKIAILRTMQHLSKVYNSIKLEFVRKLFSGVDMKLTDIEKFIIEGVNKRQLNVRIDHLSGCLRFGTAAAVSSSIDEQIYNLGTSLNKVLHNVIKNVNTTSSDLAQNVQSRKEFLSLVSSSSERDHTTTLERKVVIEQRKEALERLILYKADMMIQQQKADLEAQAKVDAARVAKEAEERAAANTLKLKQKIQVDTIAKAIAATGKIVDANELMKMDEDSRKKMLSEAQAESQKVKEEDVRRLAEQVKRLDYITRALRIEAAPIVEARYKALVEIDKKSFEDKLVELREKEVEEHKISLVEKIRLEAMQSYRPGFENDVIAFQKKEYEKELAKKAELAKEEYRMRKISRARRLKCEEDERLEEEAELEREMLKKEKEEKVLLEQAEVLRRQRQEEEAIAKENELLEQKLKRDTNINKEIDFPSARKSSGPPPSSDRWNNSSQKVPPPSMKDGPRFASKSAGPPDNMSWERKSNLPPKEKEQQSQQSDSIFKPSSSSAYVPPGARGGEAGQGLGSNKSRGPGKSFNEPEKDNFGR